MPRLAVIGCGYWGKNLVRNFAQLGALAAIADHDTTHTERLSAEFNIPVSTFEAIIADRTLDAIVLATPGPSHFELATQALRAGKHVFIEKPMTLSAASAEALGHEAERAGKIVMVGHVLRYHAAFATLLEIVQRGDIGRVRHVISTRFNMGKILDDEDVLWALAPHDLSMVTALLGQNPQHISAHGNAFLRAHITDAATVRLDYADNVSAEIRLSWMHPHKEHKLTVIGEQGMIVFDDLKGWDEKLTVYKPQLDWKTPAIIPTMPAPEHISLEASEPLRAECLHFLSCIQTGTPPLTDHREGLCIVRLLEQASQHLPTNLTSSAPQQKAMS